MIASAVIKNIYVGNGSTTQFPFTFKYNSADDIKVALYDIPTDVQTDLTSDYYIDTEKNVVLYPGYQSGQEPPSNEQPEVLPSTKKIIIYRETPQSQEKDLGDRYPLTTLERMVDKCTMLVQETKEKIERAILSDMGSDTKPSDLMQTLKEKTAAAVSSATSASDSQSASAISASEAKQYAAGVNLPKISTTDISNSLRVNKDGNWYKSIDYINIKDFGAVGDGVTDDTNSFMAAINYAQANKIGTIFIPSGSYCINIVITGSNLTFKGAYGSETSTVQSGTRLYAYDDSKPIMQIGDGSTLTTYITMYDIFLSGEKIVNTSFSNCSAIGLKILGAQYLHFYNLVLYKFKDYNIFITSSASRATCLIWFNDLIVKYTAGILFYVEWGQKWTTSVFINNAYMIPCDSGSGNAITINSMDLTISNIYIDCPDVERCGITLQHTFSGGTCGRLNGNDIILDNYGYGTTVLYHANKASTEELTDWLRVTNITTNKGYMEFSDTKFEVPSEPFSVLKSKLYDTSIFGNANFYGRTQYGISNPNGYIGYDTTNNIFVIKGNNPIRITSLKYLRLDGSWYRPLYFNHTSSVNSCLAWIDSSGYMRRKIVNSNVLSELPTGETAGTSIGSLPDAGTTTSRPAKPVVGQTYFDTTLFKPIWCKTASITDSSGNITTSAGWVDATGATI